MLILVALTITFLLAAILAFAATRPDTFSIERSAVIGTSAHKVFPLIDDFRNWSAWSPWEKLDPAQKRTHSGQESGKGAIYEWDGNAKVGAGRMEILDSSPSTKVVIKLDFVRPFEGHNTTQFVLQEKGDGTHVRWTMVGPSPYRSKLIGIFLNMDKLIGKDFEAGLANMKAVAEK